MTTLADLSEAVSSSSRVVIQGFGSGKLFDCTERPPTLRVDYSGVIAHDVADQVVSVRAGTPMQELQDELKRFGQCIPWGGLVWDDPGALSGTVGGRLSQDLPHALEAACGNWRDWVLGLTVVRPDGVIAKAGSKAVKNVAGYDVQKLFVGSRGMLGLVAEVILRTFPVRALPSHDVKTFKPGWSDNGLIQRTLSTDFEEACQVAGEDLLATHRLTSTLYRAAKDPTAVPRFAGDWLLGWGFGTRNLALDSQLHALMVRAKNIFDPTNKMNPAEMNLGLTT